jgi:tRNA (guanine-N7-)-methyltransferase
MIEPSRLFITRKRKKWKFAHFDDWPNCFQAEHVTPALWTEYFGSDQPLFVEVGAGTADLSLGLAQANPHQNYVAIDIKSDRLYTGAKYALAHNLKNIVFVRAYITDISKLFMPQSVHELWVTFPDPFPRKRQAKHRLMHPNFLQKYKSLLVPEGTLRFKTDNRDLFLWSLEQLVEQHATLYELSFDLHKSNLPDDYKITTYYERKFQAQAIPINYVAARFL